MDKFDSEDISQFINQLNQMLEEFSNNDNTTTNVFDLTEEEKAEKEYFEKANLINEQILNEREANSKKLSELTNEQLNEYEQQQAKQVNQMAQELNQNSLFIDSKKKGV